jgi:type VI secretion system FHA domain protein
MQRNDCAHPIGGSDDMFDLSTFLRSAGIEPGSVSPEMAAMLGGLLRSLLQGLVQALHARAEFRSQFRLPVSRLWISENNPLKFAADAEDALSALLRRRADRQLGPLEAVDDAFDEVRKHPLAVVAGMHAGFESVLNRFDPKQLAQEFDKRARSRALWPMPPSMRYWRQYEELFDTLARDAGSAFRHLFGEPFAQAYERQMKSEGSP